MSSFPNTPVKKRLKSSLTARQNSGNFPAKALDYNAATTFALWYKKMMDDDRFNFGLYLADDVIFHGFGRKIKSRKKVVDYLKYVMESTSHHFTLIQHRDKINIFNEIRSPPEKKKPAPCKSPELIARKRPIPNRCRSPHEQSENEEQPSKRKRIMSNYESTIENKLQCCETMDVNDKGDGIPIKKEKKYVAVTPPNKEIGQGDCLPSTSSSTDSKTDAHSHIRLQLAQLPRHAVECDGFVRFLRCDDGTEWERKCKLQVSYSEDPFDVGEYIVWGIYYSSDTSCRRNLLPLFESMSEMND